MRRWEGLPIYPLVGDKTTKVKSPELLNGVLRLGFLHPFLHAKGMPHLFPYGVQGGSNDPLTHLPVPFS